MQIRIVAVKLFSIVLLLSACRSKTKTNTEHFEKETKRRIEIIDPEATAILDTSQQIEIIADSCNWTEGPLYIRDGDYFIFSDIPDNKIYKWKEGQGKSLYLTPSGYTGIYKREKHAGSNGLLLDPQGKLILLQQGDRRIARMNSSLDNPKPEFTLLADKYHGKLLNSPNDAVYNNNGDLYFTDPPYGLDKGIDDTSRQLDFQGVYRLEKNGQVDLLTKELKYPNGITLSPDGKYLYVANSDPDNMIWMQYELNEDGLVKSQRIFYEVHSFEKKELGAPDGMKMNRRGYLFATGPEGLWIFNPGGKLVARMYTGQLTSNCALSSDEKTLYMTCDDYIMRLKLK